MPTNLLRSQFATRVAGLQIRLPQLLLTLLAAVVLAGCRTTAEEDPRLYGTDIYQMQQAQVMEYMIGPSDVLSISVWNREDLSSTVTVRPDGQLSYALVGDVYATGKTPAELQTTMEAALGKYINIIPGEVTVVIDEVHSYQVSVLGEVRQPGRFEFHNQVSVLDALAEAGGLTEFADTSSILILRPYEGKTEKIRFNYRKMTGSNNDDDRVLLFPGDIILVP